jgi:alpha-mannosidase
MSYSYARVSVLILAAVFSVPARAAAQVFPHLTVGSCAGTMSAAHESEVDRIIIDKATVDAAPNGSCSFAGDIFRLVQDPILDFRIRVRGDHPVALDVMFGEGGIGYGSGPPYSFPQTHAINIVGAQTGVLALGDLGTINDGEWHHIVFDMASALQNRLGLDPEAIGQISLGLFDQEGAQQLLAGGHPPPLPATVELRDMVTRPREPKERADNDFDFSARLSATGQADGAQRAYLVAGLIVTRQPLEQVQVVVEGEQVQALRLGDFRGRKDFALKVTVPAEISEIQAKVVAKGGKVLAQSRLRVPPELSYLQDATIDIIPNSHNDLAWLDTQQATGEWRRERVIRPAVALLETNPDYRFGLETNVLLMDYLSNVPEQADSIHKLLANGRLAFGATYTQLFQDIWGGEGLMHELYYGRKWLREHFGPDVDCVTAWGTDVPVVSMQFPQILAKSGVKYLMLGRFRPGIFDWYSPDGSKVSVGSLGIYGGLSSYYSPYRTSSIAVQMPGLLHNWEPFYESHHIPPVFPISDMTDYMPPNRELIPLVKEWNSDAERNFGARFKLKFGTAEEFMNSIAHDTAVKLPAIRGEWVEPWTYIMPGQHNMLALGREAEWNLTSAEKFWTLKYLASHGSEPYQRGTFDDAWMAHIYFDHGPGGYNGEVTDSFFMAQEQKALLLSRALLENSVHWIADRVPFPDPESLNLVVFNPLSWKRNGPALVEIPMSPDQEPRITAADGTLIPSQRVQQIPGGTIQYVIAASHIPSVGYATFKVALTKRSTGGTPREEFGDKVYENKFYRLEFVPGGLKSIYDKEINKELLRTDEFLGAEVFALDSVGCDSSSFTGFGEVPQPSWKTIEKASQYSPRWQLLESGSVRTGWRMEQLFKDATVRLDLYAYQQTKRLEINVSLLHWSGAIFKEFRMAMPVNIPDGQVTYEVPYGALEVGKDELQEAPFEGLYSVPSSRIHPRFVHDWISAANGDFGVILSSQATAWDYLDSKEMKNRFTLLQPVLLASRRSCHPQGLFFSPAGDHHYRFALTSFKGTWRDHFQFGSEVNAPFPAVAVTPNTTVPSLRTAVWSPDLVLNVAPPPAKFLPSTLSLCEVSSPHYVVSAIKLADDKRGIIVRGYEIADQNASVNLKFPLKIEKANATNLIEDDLPEPLSASGGSVQFNAGQRSINAIRISGELAP